METFKAALVLTLVAVILAADWSKYLPSGWVLVTHEELGIAADDASVDAVRRVARYCYADLGARTGSRIPIVCE